MHSKHHKRHYGRMSLGIFSKNLGAVMLCRECGNEIPEGSSWCIKCGARQDAPIQLSQLMPAQQPLPIYMKESFLSGTIELDSKDALNGTSPRERKTAQRVLSMSKEIDPGPDNDDRPIRIIGSPEWEKQFHKWRDRNQRASALEKEGQIDKAIALYQQNVCEWSELPGDYKRLSIIYEKRGDLKKALEYCELALISPACTLSPQDVARSNFTERKRKLQERIAKRQEREQG